MLKFEKLHSESRYEKVRDFSKELDTLDILGYYIYPWMLLNGDKIPIYTETPEDVTVIYYTSTSTGCWIRENLKTGEMSSRFYLSQEFMNNFDLVRVIPGGGYRGTDSYLRIMVKDNLKSSKW